jgi:hypothetical protein
MDAQLADLSSIEIPARHSIRALGVGKEKEIKGRAELKASRVTLMSES